VICVCGIISLISASYCSEVSKHGFVKLFKFHVIQKCTLYLALGGTLRGATEHEYKCENIINFVSDILES